MGPQTLAQGGHILSSPQVLLGPPKKGADWVWIRMTHTLMAVKTLNTKVIRRSILNHILFYHFLLTSSHLGADDRCQCAI